uniref:Uncharacterized protein n=1 Tax=Pararge aegeria TaxID=116150 RepID=S4PSZ4_9NEOP
MTLNCNVSILQNNQVFTQFFDYVQRSSIQGVQSWVCIASSVRPITRHIGLSKNFDWLNAIRFARYRRRMFRP